MAIFQTFIGVYNGSGNTKYTFVIGVVRLWLLRIPLILIFKYFTDLGASGIWYAMLLSNLLIVILGTFLYKKVDYKPKIRIG
jgi:Na+-driven multidrug efflux pump